MRRIVSFKCAGDLLAGTLDEGPSATGLLWISGGNEIRSGAYAGQATLAAELAAKGHSVFRYDRRGVGDSEGSNGGFESSADDIAAAVAAFAVEARQIKRIVAFGNCDAAAALALFHSGLAIDALLLANPWVIEMASQDKEATVPPAAAIRSRYWARLKNPRSIIDLVTGKINIRKLAGGLTKAVHRDQPSGLSTRIAHALAATDIPVSILLARRDTTALAFQSVWHDKSYSAVRAKANVTLEQIDSASHSFADAVSRAWLVERIERALST